MRSIPSLVAALLLAAANPSPAPAQPAPPAPGKPMPTLGVAEIANPFGLSLLDALARKRAQESVFVSPVSVATALAMLANGASGTTRDELLRALGAESHGTDALNAAFDDYLASLERERERRGIGVPFELTMANATWARDGVPIRDAFAATLARDFRAHATTADFGDPATVDAINDWVSKNTRGMIPRVVERLEKDELLLLINTIAFKGQWLEPFPAAATAPAPFTRPGLPTLRVPMMHRSGTFLYARLADRGLTAVAMPYMGGRARMIVVLGDDPNAGVPAIDAAAWTAIRDALRQRAGTVSLPRIDLDRREQLKPVLSAMGLDKMFRAGTDLNGISPENPQVAQVIHFSALDVDEQGTEAAAATVIRLRKGRPPRQVDPFRFVCDRPFFLAIEDRRTGAALFVGRIVDPGTRAATPTATPERPKTKTRGAAH